MSEKLIADLQKRNGALEFQLREMGDYLRKFTKFYYDMLEVSLVNSSLINFDPSKTPDYDMNYYRISKSQYDTFREWSKLIKEFNKSNGVNRT